MPNKQRLLQRIAALQERWHLLSQKLAALSEQQILESRVEEKLRLECLIAETEAEREQLEQKLSSLEAQLSSTGGRDREQESITYQQLGKIAQEQGDFAAAEQWYRKSLAINEELGNERLATIAYYNLGVIAQERGDNTAAEQWYRKSLAIEEKLGNEHGAAASLARLGQLLQGRGEQEAAHAYLKRALASREKILGTDHPDTIATRDLLQFGEQALTRRQFVQTIPWGDRLLRRLEQDGARLTHIHSAGNESWLLCVHLPEALQEAYGIAPEVLLLAVQGELQARDLQKARQVLYEQEFHLDLDLLVVVDDKPRLAERLDRMFQLWGQWVPWPPYHGEFSPLAEQFRSYLPNYDVFEQRDPVRGRQVIGRNEVVADLSKRLLRGQAVGIFGLRKVGKTTVVRAVTDKLDPASVRLEAPAVGSLTADQAKSSLLVAWLDVERIYERTLESLLNRLTRELERRLASAKLVLPQPESSATPLARLNTVLEAALQHSPFPIGIVLDEYDLLFEGSSGESAIQGIEKLFRLFRAHAQDTGRLALVVIGRDPYFLQRSEMGGHPNPMLNWFIPRWLGPLQQVDADELLQKLGRRVLLDVGLETRKTALYWTGGHPLLHRQYGSALLELARSRRIEQTTVATDAFHQDAIDVFLERDAVITLCREVFHLLEGRYQEAAILLDDLCRESQIETSAVMEGYGGWHDPATGTLKNFGLVLGNAQAPWIPEIFHWYLRTFMPRRRILQA